MNELRGAKDGATGFHGEIAQSFSEKYRTNENFRARLALWEELIRKYASPTGRSMDLGCGPGRMTNALCRFSGDVVAIDGSVGMIRLAAGATRDAGADVEFVQALITPELLQRWDGGSFELIISSSVFEYLPGAAAVVSEAFRLLRPGGTLLLSIPNTKSWFRHVETAAYRLLGWPKYRKFVINSWAPAISLDILRRSGFHIENVRYDGYVPIYSTLFAWLPQRALRPMLVIVARKSTT